MMRDNNSTNYTYDPENRISGAAGFTYTYDADGNQVEIVWERPNARQMFSEGRHDSDEPLSYQR